MKISQEVQVLKEGNAECKHVFLSDGAGSFGVLPLSHTLTQVCFLCGQLQVTHTYKDNTNPFTFKSAVQRFHQEG